MGYNSEMETAQLDPERQKKAKEYSRISRRLMLVDLLISAVYMIAWLAFGWAVHLRSALEQITTNPWLLILLFAAVFGLILLVIDLPMSYYSGFVLPHRFGQSNQTHKDWITDQLKGLAVSGVLGVILLEIVYWLLRAAPQTWWLWVALVMLVFNVVLANLAPVLLMPLFNKYVPIGSEHQDLVDRLKRLFQQAGAKVEGVYQFDMSRRTKSANAALTGLGSTRRIILGDTLINEFSIDEIEVVMAHELGHHVHRDIPVLIAVQTILTLVGLWIASLVLNWGVGAFGMRSIADPATLPLLGLAMGIYGLITMPIGNGISRWRERLADQYALETTGYAAAFASAMTRLANQNLAEVDPEPWEEFLLYSHPTLNKRIKMANEYAQGR